MTFVETLEPKAVWAHFDRILTIPRGSKDEGQIRKYVIDQAEKNGLSYDEDATGNIIVRVPGTKGHEKAPALILQGHLDMVNEKNSDVQHDFDKDPIQPERDGDYLTAKGTTLGSDNGIGVATMLAVMEADGVVHGPLELVFTVDEETGLTGAAGLKGDMLEARQLINMDSEEEGALYVGCAGGGDSTLTLDLATEAPPSGATAIRLRLAGLKGGHSGVDIHLQRGNAVKLMARMLHAGALKTPFRLAAFEGGNKHNAIPREAVAVVVVPGPVSGDLTDRIKAEFEAVKVEYGKPDPGMQLDIDSTDVPNTVWNTDTTWTVLRLIEGLPHGVLAMSNDVPDLVETSNNVAVVQAKDGKLVITTSSRSSIDAALEAVRREIRAVGQLAGADVEEHDAYPGWKPNLDSHLLQVVKELHTQMFGEPEIKAIHAGLEAGIIGEKVPGMDMISFGPQIEFPHSPDERVGIESVGRFYQLVKATLEKLA